MNPLRTNRTTRTRTNTRSFFNFCKISILYERCGRAPVPVPFQLADYALMNFSSGWLYLRIAALYSPRDRRLE